VNANVDTRTSFFLKNLHIINAKTNEYGGAIKTTDEVSVTVDKVQFTNNVADKGGGAMFLGWNSSLTVTNSNFTEIRPPQPTTNAVLGLLLLSALKT
jgi:hypothetical protein